MQKQYVKEYYQLSKYHWWWQVRRRIVFSELANLHFSTSTKNTLIDLGCGAGVNLSYLKKWFSIFGVEPDADLRAAAKKITNRPILSGTLPNNLPKEIPNPDVVLLLDVLEHVQEDEKSLKTIHKKLKKNGYLILNVPAMQWLWSTHDEVNEHKRRYSLQEIRTLLKKAGFEIIKLRYWGHTFVPIVWIERVLLKKNSDEYSVPIPPTWLNKLFLQYSKLEYRLTDSLRLPFGLSIVAVVKKP